MRNGNAVIDWDVDDFSERGLEHEPPLVCAADRVELLLKVTACVSVEPYHGVIHTQLSRVAVVLRVARRKLYIVDVCIVDGDVLAVPYYSD